MNIEDVNTCKYMQIVHVKTQKNDRKFISPRMGSIVVIPELDGQKAIEEPTC